MLPALCVFFSSFALYLVTMNGTLPSYRDSGDLIASVNSLGIAHPPGYPGYVLVGKVVSSLVPWGSQAYCVNLLSAIAAAAAVGVLLLTVRKRLAAGLLPSLLVAVLLAMAPALVELAQVAEMYTLGLLLAALILFFSLGKPAQLSLATLLLGIGLGVHPTLLFLAPIVLLAWWDHHGSERPSLGQLAICFAIGISVFAFLPIRSARDPLQNWGNPTSWRNFWRLVTRADYGGLKLHPVESQLAWTPESIGDQLRYFGLTLLHEWTVVGLTLGVLGAGVSLLKDRSLRSMGFIGAFLLAGPAFFVLSNLPLAESTTPAILQPYMLLVDLLWALWVVSGLTAVLQRLPRAGRGIFLGVCLAGSAAASRPWVMASHRADFATYDYGRHLMQSLPTGAVLFDPDDPTAFTLRALQLTEHRRNDLILLNFFRTRWGYEEIRKRWPELLPPHSVNSAQELEQTFWTYSLHRRPFFGELPQKLPASLPYASAALVYQAGRPADTGTLRHAEQLFELYARRGNRRTDEQRDFFGRHLVSYYSAAHNNLGLQYAAASRSADARRQYWQALVIEPTLAAAYNNLGILEYQDQRFPAAIALYRKALEFDPTNEGLQRNLAGAYAARGLPASGSGPSPTGDVPPPLNERKRPVDKTIVFH